MAVLISGCSSGAAICLAVPLVDLWSSSVATRHSSSKLGSALAAPSVDNALNLYCHNLGVLAVGGADVLPPWLNLCCFHSLTDDVCLAVHKAHDAVVILGVLVAHTSALHHSELVKAELHSLNSLPVLRRAKRPEVTEYRLEHRQWCQSVEVTPEAVLWRAKRPKGRAVLQFGNDVHLQIPSPHIVPCR